MSRLTVLLVAVLLFTAAPRAAGSQSSTVEERMTALEARVLLLEQAVASLTSGGVPAAPAQPASTSAALFEASGTGGAETDFFDAPGRVEVCWDVSGRSPSGAYGGEASFYLTPASGAGTNSVSDKTGTGCTFANLRAGRYYIKVIATSWSIWRVTVRAA